MEQREAFDAGWFGSLEAAAAAALEHGRPLRIPPGIYQTDWTPPEGLTILSDYPGAVELRLKDGALLTIGPVSPLTETDIRRKVPPMVSDGASTLRAKHVTAITSAGNVSALKTALLAALPDLRFRDE